MCSFASILSEAHKLYYGSLRCSRREGPLEFAACPGITQWQRPRQCPGTFGFRLRRVCRLCPKRAEARTMVRSGRRARSRQAGGGGGGGPRPAGPEGPLALSARACQCQALPVRPRGAVASAATRRTRTQQDAARLRTPPSPRPTSIMIARARSGSHHPGAPALPEVGRPTMLPTVDPAGRWARAKSCPSSCCATRPREPTGSKLRLPRRPNMPMIRAAAMAADNKRSNLTRLIAESALQCQPPSSCVPT